MVRWSLVALVALVATSGGCMAHKLKLLTPEEKDCFESTKVLMSADEVKDFLKQKTKDDHDKWLKTHGKPKDYWDTFYQYGADERKAILTGDVHKGMDEVEVYMAWGAPNSESRPAGRPAERSKLLLYRFEVQPDGSVLVWTPNSKTLHNAVSTYQMDVFVDDGVVTEIDKKDKWD